MVSSITAISQPETAINQISGSGTNQRIKQAIHQASLRTGVDFSYLLNKASAESSLNPTAKASTSSATGLFQFTSQTWLQMVKNHGDQYNLGDYASHISVDSGGVAHVKDPTWRRAILDLRKDPSVSAEMAGELDKSNMSSLKSDVGGKIGATELYLAHFLGASGAGDFIDTFRKNPQAKAADVLPEAAAANKSVFYDKTGAPRSVKDIYQRFAQKFDHMHDMPDSSATIRIADAAPEISNDAFGVNGMSHSAGGSAFVPPVISKINANASSSLYAAMVLAQMDYSHASGAKTGWGHEQDEKNSKNSAIATLHVIS